MKKKKKLKEEEVVPVEGRDYTSKVGRVICNTLQAWAEADWRYGDIESRKSDHCNYINN